jgi:hypothetical protein
MVAISNAQLPKRPNREFSKELLELLRQDPKGMTSYFSWLAEHHPALFVSLIGRALPQRQPTGADDPIEAMIRTAEDIEALFRSRHIPPLLTEGVYNLPKRIDLRNPPVIDVTPALKARDDEQ